MPHLWKLLVLVEMSDRKTQDEVGDVHGATILLLLWTPCAAHEEEEGVVGAEGEAGAWSRRPQSVELEVP